MYNGLCHAGTWGTLGSSTTNYFGVVFDLVLLVGLFSGIVLLAFLALKYARVSTARAPVSGQPTAKESLQALYARGEITREEYDLRKKELS